MDAAGLSRRIAEGLNAAAYVVSASAPGYVVRPISEGGARRAGLNYIGEVVTLIP